MTFNSYIFILFFLPAVLAGYYFCFFRKSSRLVHVFLLVASIIFYISAGWEMLVLLGINILINYGLFCGIKVCQKSRPAWIKYLLGAGVICNLGILMYFKYYNFFVDSFNLLFGPRLAVREILAPLGISFITFQQIAFLVDASRQEISSCSFMDYMLFISYFPHVSSGPIIRHSDFLPLLHADRKMDWDKFSAGLYMFFMGLGKKVLIADVFGSAVDWGYANIDSLNSTSAVFISLAYTMQIYFDFSGYSDMAIGISRMLQLDLPINFNSPYKADTILEFWKRWHMTLTGFFTKYLYIPLGGNRKGKARTYVNTLIVFLCSGLWHGASWTFVIWGGVHGCFMVFTKHFQKVFDRLPVFLNKSITLLFVNFTWILFRAQSFTVFKQMIKILLKNDWGRLRDEISACFRPVILEELGCPDWVYAVIFSAVIVFVVLKCDNVQERAEHMKYSLLSCLWVLAVAVISILSLSGVSTFVYSLF